MQNLSWSKTGFVSREVFSLTTLNLLLQNRLCAVPKPAATKPALRQRLTCCSKTGFVPTLNLPHQNRFCIGTKPAFSFWRCKICLDTKPVLYQDRFCSLTDVGHDTNQFWTDHIGAYSLAAPLLKFSKMLTRRGGKSRGSNLWQSVQWWQEFMYWYHCVALRSRFLVTVSSYKEVDVLGQNELY